MKLFELKNWELEVSEEVWGLLPFKKILKRDKTKEKSKALKEMLFIFYYTDIKSDYLITPQDLRKEEIKKDIGLEDDWDIDEVIEEAMVLYKKRSKTINEELYESAIKSAVDIAEYLRNTKELLAERDLNNKPTIDISKITTALQKVPKLMSDLNSAYKELIKEKHDSSNKMSGSRAHNIFEDGI